MANKPIYNRIYDNEYYSSSQCFIYIGDVLIDEITSFHYNLVQNKTPIYGYASQLFDDCAPGRVVVQGSFTINYKEQGYLWAVLRRYKQVSDSMVGYTATRNHNNINSIIEDKLLSVQEGHRRDMPSLMDENYIRVGYNGTRINRASIERIMLGEATRGENTKFYHDMAGYANGENGAFEDLTSAFEEQIWEPNINNEELINQIRRTDDNTFDDFDIYMLFGDYSNPIANKTCTKIVGVRLLTSGKTISMSGAPIQEQYSFLAKTVL